MTRTTSEQRRLNVSTYAQPVLFRYRAPTMECGMFPISQTRSVRKNVKLEFDDNYLYFFVTGDLGFHGAYSYFCMVFPLADSTPPRRRSVLGVTVGKLLSPMLS